MIGTTMALAPQAAPNPARNQPPARNLNANLTTSAAGIAALRTAEGQRNGGAYYDDQANNCTRGTGILVHRGPCSATELSRQPDQQDNETDLQTRLHGVERQVIAQVTGRQLTQAQFDALVSATFNLGARHARPILQRANNNDDNGVVLELRDHVFIQPRDARGVPNGPLRRSQGLANRREREAQPFLPGRP